MLCSFTDCALACSFDATVLFVSARDRVVFPQISFKVSCQQVLDMSASSHSGAAFQMDESQRTNDGADDDVDMATHDPIEDIVIDESAADPIEDVDAADRDNKVVDSTVESLAIKYMAQKASIQHATLRAFRSLHPTESTEELAHRWVNHMTAF